MLATLLATACQEETLPSPDYTVSGRNVTLTIPVTFPKMDIKTSRASLEDWQIDQVESIWIRTYNADTRQATSEWLKLTPGSTDKEPATHNVTIDTKSGNSYIVAVGNVSNIGIDKNNPNEQAPLSDLLEKADTWDKFLDIAVLSPSTYETVSAPLPPLPMAGCYTNLLPADGNHSRPHRLDDWQTVNFQPVTIPSTGDGQFTLSDGAIHLRRLVSQITFNIIPGHDYKSGLDIRVTPNSYQVVNVPVYSWLYERSATGGMTANYGDICTQDSKEDFYKTPAQYSGTSIQPVDRTEHPELPDGTYTFNFWQAENKHIGTAANYGQREIESKNIEENEASGTQYQTNTGLFTSLTGDIWTPNNMATYVVVNCQVEYLGRLDVNNDGEINGSGTNSEVFRSGTANYKIHLGYMNSIPTDFNCFRNTKYTYNITVNGLDDIRVEAYHGNETAGAEGMVSDVENETINLDCHYHAFNIELSDIDLTAWNAETGQGFGFIITSYEHGREYTYQETDFADGHAQSSEESKYMNWIELRKTTDKGTLAAYKPRVGEYADGLTFTLLDASKGISENQRAIPDAEGKQWYTVFVNEYTYEAENANEQSDGQPIWAGYVNQNPRRFYIRVTRSVSADGESLYARSKYAMSQESIMTYYSTENISQIQTAGEVAGSAVGVERENESFGLNLRRSFVAATDKINGRYNLMQFTHHTYNKNRWEENDNASQSLWSNFVDIERPQEIPAGQTGKPVQTVESNNPVRLPKIADFEGELSNSLSTNNNPSPGNNLVNAMTDYDPQPRADRNSGVYIEAINACMNRNRDNNGDGIISNDEIRWYVPTIGKYLRLVLGNQSLKEPLMDYDNISRLVNPNGTGFTSNDLIGQYMFFGSDGCVLWAMEGLSTSFWGQWGSTSPVAPWQVRCIRNLGINLSADIVATDKTIPAYTFEPRSGNDASRGGVVRMSFYDDNSIRKTPYDGNGSGTRQMPVHPIYNQTYNSLYTAFEISEGANRHSYQNGSGQTINSNFYYDNTINNQNLQTLTVSVNNNPCDGLNKGGNTGWRVPNLKELAIMRNLGVFDEMIQWNSGYNAFEAAGFGLSCSVSAFNSSGIKMEVNISNNTSQKFMVTRNDGLTQAQGDKYFVRCVRDVR